jgi:hypothetical protein
MYFDRYWTAFALEEEYEQFGMARIAKAHNDKVEELEQKIAKLEFLLESQSALVQDVF